MLQRLDLSGNPVNVPEERLVMIYILPGLTVLSGEEVTAKERVLGRITTEEGTR